MKFLQRRVLSVAITTGVCCLGSGVNAQTFTDSLTGGKVGGTFNLRYEMVDEDNALEDAEALTLRSVLRYTTGTWNGFSAMLEAEDVTIIGIDDYSVPQTGFHTGEYSTIADPETTEVNQSYVQYKQDAFTAKLGRQDIRFDNQRFVGAVPWRQDFQTFDALNLEYKTDKFGLNYNYINRRNRIFAEAADIKSKDNIVHANMATPIGMLTGYAYLLEEDIPTNNSLDTVGIRLTGSKMIGEQSFSYIAEFATQEYERGVAEADADYFLLEAGTTFGAITAKLGYESLGSDDGMYGFGTPLATVHLFQGWADQFIATPAQGINDMYLSLATPVAGGSFTFVYHDYEADEDSAGVSDLGSEIDLQWTKPFMEKYTFGLKYASYSDGDLASKVDKRIFWSWVQLNF
jgi:hypothetical protein